MCVAIGTVYYCKIVQIHRYLFLTTRKIFTIFHATRSIKVMKLAITYESMLNFFKTVEIKARKVNYVFSNIQGKDLDVQPHYYHTAKSDLQSYLKISCRCM